MPRKPSKTLNNEETIEEPKVVTKSKQTVKSTKEKSNTKTTSKSSTTKSATKKTSSTTKASKSDKSLDSNVSSAKSTKKVAEPKEEPKTKAKKVAEEKATKTTTKATTTKKKTSTAKETKSAKPATSSKETKAKATKKVATKKAASKADKPKSTTRRTKKPKEELVTTTGSLKNSDIIEYYDLPYRYNQTIVRLLAQTPTTLFIYWDISDVDRENFIKQYGENFFNDTKPVLIIHNDTKNYSFEVEVDDFANSWYLHVKDANCKYSIELGRRPKYYNNEKHVYLSNDYLYVASSNVMDTPNDCILFDRNLKNVYFKDVKTNIVTVKGITSISFLHMSKIYDMYDLHNDLEDRPAYLDLKSPSSSNPSSTFR